MLDKLGEPAPVSWLTLEAETSVMKKKSPLWRVASRPAWQFQLDLLNGLPHAFQTCLPSPQDCVSHFF